MGYDSREAMLDSLSAELAVLEAKHPDLAASLRGVDGLSGLLQWGHRVGLPVEDIEIIVQDEYTHDAILSWLDRYLVFGLT